MINRFQCCMHSYANNIISIVLTYALPLNTNISLNHQPQECVKNAVWNKVDVVSLQCTYCLGVSMEKLYWLSPIALLVASGASSQLVTIALPIVCQSIHLIHNSGMAGNTVKTAGPIYLFFMARSFWVDNAGLFNFFNSICHVCWNRQKQTTAYCISWHGHLHSTSLQMLLLCGLMQSFIMIC